MKLYSLILLIILSISNCIEFNPELQKNILNFGYGINYKYEGMLTHSFDRFYIITKFILPSIGDIRFSHLTFDDSCSYMNKEYAPNKDSSKYLKELKRYCHKLKPLVSYYSKLIKSYNSTVYDLLENKIKPLFPDKPRHKHGLVTIVSGFIGLAYEGISSFLQRKWDNALKRAVLAMDNDINTQHNILLKLDNTMLMYGLYNAEMLEKLINTIHNIHNVMTSHERLFAGEHNPTIFRLTYTTSLGVQQYAFNSLLYLRVIQDKYISLYRELIVQLKAYLSAIRILSKGYLPTTLIPPNKLQDILAEVRRSLHQTNPDYMLVFDKLHMYYDMPLVTFGVDRSMNLVIQFPLFIQPYIQEPLLLHQIETVPVPILDTNTEANSYTHLQVNKPYIALNKEMYISLTNEELRSCKKIGKMFYCKELFVVKHKSSYSCESAIYFNLTTDIIKDNCNFDFYYNKSDIIPIPTILDGGNEIILANWPNDKHVICNINNDIPVKIPSHPYVLVDRGILCNCGLEADNHHLLESLAACDKTNTKLKMYFTINLAFTNYLNEISNLTDHHSIDRSITEYEQVLPIHINVSGTNFDSSLYLRPSRLRDFIYKHVQDNSQEIFDLQKRHTLHASLSYKNFFLNTIVNIFTFTSSMVSMITIILVIYLYCKHKHIRTIITSLILHKAKEVEANTLTKQENTECQTLAYIGITLTLLSMMIVVLLHYRRSKFCRGYRFSNVVKIVLFISDIQHYIPVKLTKASGSPQLFKLIGTLNSEDIKLNKNYLWDTLEINWNKIKLTFNDSEIKLPWLVTIKMRDKIRIRRMMSRDTQNSHVMIKQGITWYNPEAEIRTI